MPDKTKPKKSFPYIQIRIEPEIKDIWIKFVKKHSDIRNMTHLVAAAVEKFMDEFDNPTSVSSNGNNTKELLKYFMEENNKKEKQLSEAISKLTDIQVAMAKKANVKDETDLTAKVYGMLSRGSFNEKEIADILDKDEGLITDICNSLVKKGAIELDPETKKLMRYRLK